MEVSTPFPGPFARRSAGRVDAKRSVPLELGEVERLDAEAVANQRQPAAVALVEREGEHAVEALHAARPPFRPGLDDHLGVAGGREAVALGLELGAELGIIVDAAVEGDGQPQLGVDEGLRRGFGQVDDLQPPVGEPDRAANDRAGAVRAAGRHRVSHALEPRGRDSAAGEVDLSADAAHMRAGPLLRFVELNRFDSEQLGD